MSKIRNVIYIHSHDSGKFFSPYGHRVPTENLAKFAQEAIVFDQAFCVSPTCSPSRSGLLTGKYPHNNGMLGLTNRGFALNDYSSHLVQILNRHNFHTVLCGIQHEAGKYTDHEEGAEIIGYRQNITQNIKHYEEVDYVHWDVENSEVLSNWILDYCSEKPFFVSYGMFSTHREYPLADSSILQNDIDLPEWLDKDGAIRDDFAGHIKSLTYFDKCFGTVINALKKTRHYQDTLILVTTDHGIAFPGAKCTLLDAGMGVSLIARIPGSSNLGKRYPYLISHIDILPTLFGLLGIEDQQNLMGKDYSSVLISDFGKVRDEIFGEVNFHTSYEPMRCIRTENFKYIKYFDSNYSKYNLSNIDNSPTKTYYLNKGLKQKNKELEHLYDLKSDPLETINLIDKHEFREVVDDLRKRLHDWMIETNDYLLNGPLEFEKHWKVNKSSAIDPKSRDLDDFL